MGDLEPGIDLSFEDAEKISQKVITLGQRLRHYGICHNDIHLNNIILRQPLDEPVLIDWGQADLGFAHVSCRKNWRNWCLINDFETDIRHILQRASLWHRFTTPLSDEDTRRYAKSAGAREEDFYDGESGELAEGPQRPASAL
ncbi:hypothetical protein C0995_012048 [Termitomyces sp. Mi166|nr:hypothetical protein C0995_012048 [Termitomyces sp. Mi166\